MEITICRYCLTVWKKRPFLCDCKSNVFMKDYEANNEDILKLKQNPKFIFKENNKD